MIFVKNAGRFGKSLKARAAEIVEREVSRMEQAADQIEADASASVEVDTGALRDSGERLPTKQESGSYVARVSFGGPTAPYAGIVHDAPWSKSEGFLANAAKANGWPSK